MIIVKKRFTDDVDVVGTTPFLVKLKKTIEFTMPGVEGKMVGSYDGRSENAVVIGVDTAIGFALAHALHAEGFGVIGQGDAKKAPCSLLKEYRQTDYKSYDIPADCNLVLFCHDVAAHVERHLAAL